MYKILPHILFHSDTLSKMGCKKHFPLMTPFQDIYKSYTSQKKAPCNDKDVYVIMAWFTFSCYYICPGTYSMCND